MTAVLTETEAFTAALSSPPIPGPAMPTVLIADDDDDVRDVIDFKLQVAGFRTLTADNGCSALSLATGADDYLPKPFSQAEMLRREVDKFLAGVRAA